jgi:hypothetical protein
MSLSKSKVRTTSKSRNEHIAVEFNYENGKNDFDLACFSEFNCDLDSEPKKTVRRVCVPPAPFAANGMYHAASSLAEPLVEKPRLVRASSDVSEATLTARIAKRKLLIGTGLCFFFMITEIVRRGRRLSAGQSQPPVQRLGAQTGY